MTVTIPAGSLMEASLLGRAVEESLADSTALSEAVDALLERVDELGGIAVQAVSQSAALIIGAAIVASRGRVRQATLPGSGGSDSKVLLVEAVAVGEGQLERAIEGARRNQADWVGTWLWHASARLDPGRLDADDVRVFRKEEDQL